MLYLSLKVINLSEVCSAYLVLKIHIGPVRAYINHPFLETLYEKFEKKKLSKKFFLDRNPKTFIAFYSFELKP